MYRPWALPAHLRPPASDDKDVETVGRLDTVSKPKSWPARLVAIAVLLALVGAISLGELHAQDQSRADTQLRFTTATATAARFVHVYAEAVLHHDATLAEERLSGPRPTATDLVDFDQDLGLGPTVLLGSRGRLLAVSPLLPWVIGEQIAARYAQLTKAQQGRPTVSVVTASAGDNVPVVGFTVPFRTPYGRRVIAGAISVASTPLGLYLRNLYPVAGTSSYLIDTNGRIVSATTAQATDLAQADPELARAITIGARSGEEDGNFYSVRTVPGTPWRLVMVCSAAALFRNNLAQYLPWLEILAFATVAAALAAFVLRTREQRFEMTVLAGLDTLTGIANRRRVESELRVACSAANRHSQPLAVMVVDVDHFKEVNDAMGHKAGDQVLREITRQLAGCLRTEDSLGRWGGEEFLIVLPYTQPEGAAGLAQRLLDVVRYADIQIANRSLNVTISVGTAVALSGADPETLVQAADAAMYRAKQAGRNRGEMVSLGHAGPGQACPGPAQPRHPVNV